MPRAKSKALSLETSVTPEVAKGWIREVNKNLLRANKGEALGQERCSCELELVHLDTQT